MNAEETIERAGRLLAAAAPEGSTVILFGSHAHGTSDADSDYDFLVIEPEVASRVEEMVRLRDALDPLRIAADVLVVSRSHAAERSVTGTVLGDAITEGRVLVTA